MMTNQHHSCMIPSAWEECFILNLYKGKGEALDHSKYYSLKLTDQVMKLLEWVLNFYICEIVNIDEMQFSFVPGRGITDLIFVVCLLEEKYIATNKLLYFAFVNLEKVFDHVPMKVLRWALRSLGVMQRLCRNDCAMIHLICGINDRDKIPSASLLQKLGIRDITLVLRCWWLRWYGYVQRAMSCIKFIKNF